VTRRTLLLPLLLLSTAPLAAQVGYEPAASPFEDLRGRMALTLAPGLLAIAGDPAGVAPRSGAVLSARYEFFLTGPLWLQSRLTYAPQLERTVKDPLFRGAERFDHPSYRPLAIVDVGFGLNLTGNKSWNRIVPQFHSALGIVTGGTNRFDEGGYRFGTKLTYNYGLGVRYVTGRDWEWHGDLTHQFWKYNYPDSYRNEDSANPTPILSGRSLSATKGNLQLSIGVSRFFFR
jgi:hypothetical protein